MILVIAARLFEEYFDGGWPDQFSWWAIITACSAVVLVGLVVAIVNVSQPTGAVAAVVLASTLAALAVSVASWGQFAAHAHGREDREEALRKCERTVSKMSAEDVAGSRYMTSVMTARPMAASSLYMLHEPAGFPGDFAAKQRQAAAKAWDALRADSDSVADICAATLAQFGEDSSTQMPAAYRYGTANTTGEPVDVVIE